jgi:O-antigen/teichoic acid export membrane protein
MIAAARRRMAPLMPLMGKSLLHIVFQVVAMLVPIVCLPLVTRAMMPEEYGRFSLYLVVAGFLLPVVSVGIDQVLSNNYYRFTKAQNRAYLGRCLGNMLLTCAGFSVLMALLAGLLTRWVQLPVYGLMTLGAFAALSFLVVAGQTVALMEKDNRVQGVFIVGRAVLVYAVALPLLVVSSSWNVMLASNFAMLAVLAGMSWLYLRRLGLVELEIGAGAVKYVWAMGGMLVFFALSNQIILMTDRMVIQYLLGTHSVGLYAIPQQLMAGCMMLVLALTRVSAPWTIRMMTDGGEAQLRQMARLMYLFWMLIVGGFAIAALVGGWVVDMLTSEAYDEAIPLVYPLALASMFNTLFILNSSLLVFLRRMRFLSVLTLLAGVTNAALSIGMTHVYGLGGAAYACAFTFGLITVVATFEMFRSMDNVPWRAAAGDVLGVPLRLLASFR